LHNFNCIYCLFCVADPDPHHFGKLDTDPDPDPHRNGKLGLDSDQHQNEKQDPKPDPHQSEKVEDLAG
jgi:hypothetical protein